ncbi:thiamine phosphate synthase [Desulfovibrio sp. OttesenSCG-928-C06]|nr:thiamine phosphate synthase [Desulfovibrio sp. OttesenSCG-928-C06]
MNKKLDLSLYLVLDPGMCGGIEGMAHTTRLAVENGVTVVQLRAEEYKKGQCYIAAKALMDVLASTSVPLIINNDVDIALAVNADGVHVGQKDLPPAIARKLLGPDKILGLSASNESEVLASAAENVDYLGIGPIYPTMSKKDAAPATGVDGLRHLVQIKTMPAVAIGGIHHGNLNDVMDTGVEGISVISAICGQSDIAGRTRELAAGLAKYR